MRALYSSKYYAGAVNTALLLLRLGVGILILKHGYGKISNFNTIKTHFMNFMHLGSTVSLVLVIFAEFFCAILIILGLFTRFACIPLIIGMGTVVFMINHGNLAGKNETPVLFLGCFIVLLITGPGKASIDRLIGK